MNDATVSVARRKYAQVFSGKHALLPVVHVLDLRQAMRNVALAKRLGADGVFLISHSLPYRDLFAIYAQVRSDFPGFWIGLNALDLRGLARYELIPHGVAGIWVDDAAIKEEFTTQALAAERTRARLARGDHPLFFGGVAFKYREKVRDLERVTVDALPHVDVLTTSGAATGSPAHPTKLAVMRSAGGDVPIALASGVTPANVWEYLPNVDAFLVSTSICDEADNFDPAKLAALRAAIPA